MKRFALLLLTLFFATTVCVAQQEQSKDEFYYIDNGQVRLGVDLGGGGSVFFFAESQTGRNLLNHADKGRYVQQSYYGAKDGSMWGDKPWAWNPVQGGGYKHAPATILKQKLRGKSIWIRTMPKHWATSEDITDAVMEQTITLNDRVAHIRYKFIYKGDIDHPSKPQELPAVFADYALPNLIIYDGKSPWTGDELTSVVPGWPNESHKSTECWAAYVDDNMWGLGVFFPGTTEMTTYRHPGKSGPKGGGCSYFAPVKKFAITKGFVYEYDVYLTIDNVSNMRDAFYKLNKK